MRSMAMAQSARPPSCARTRGVRELKDPIIITTSARKGGKEQWRRTKEAETQFRERRREKVRHRPRKSSVTSLRPDLNPKQTTLPMRLLVN